MFKAIISFCFVLTLLIPVISRGQNASPPPPLENKVYDSMVGDWTADATMMGMPFIENVKITWDLNHQFIVMDMMATNKTNTNITYQGKGLLVWMKKETLKYGGSIHGAHPVFQPEQDFLTEEF